MQCGAKIKNRDSISVISEVHKDLATGFSGTEIVACLWIFFNTEKFGISKKFANAFISPSI